MYVVVGIAYAWHLDQSDNDKHGHDDKANDEVGRYEHTEVGIL